VSTINIKTEADSNDIIVSSQHVKPSTGMFVVLMLYSLCIHFSYLHRVMLCIDCAYEARL